MCAVQWLQHHLQRSTRIESAQREFFSSLMRSWSLRGIWSSEGGSEGLGLERSVGDMNFVGLRSCGANGNSTLSCASVQTRSWRHCERPQICGKQHAYTFFVNPPPQKKKISTGKAKNTDFHFHRLFVFGPHYQLHAFMQCRAVESTWKWEVGKGTVKPPKSMSALAESTCHANR